MKDEFERPKVMEKLLSAGNLENAFASISDVAPNNLADRLSATERLRPIVSVIAPDADAIITDRYVTVTAAVDLPVGIKLVPPKAFANGVPAESRRLQRVTESGGYRTCEYSWRLPLPSDSRIKIQVLASSELGHGAIAETEIRHVVEKNPPPGKIYLLAVGVNKYADGQIPSLEFAVNNANAVSRVLTQSSRRLQRTDVALLTNQSVNRSLWRVTTQHLADELRNTAGPDDLLIIFLSGHGVRDEQSEQYFYLTASSRYYDILGRRYADCISFDDLSIFSQLPCRKLVVLDTCHSGAIQTLQQRNLKTVVRALENDLMFTLTASEGSQVAIESKERNLGLFTARLVEGLQGAGDAKSLGGNGDGQVSLAEAIRYVQATVPVDAAGLKFQQYPTASPSDLLELVDFPLTEISR